MKNNPGIIFFLQIFEPEDRNENVKRQRLSELPKPTSIMPSTSSTSMSSSTSTKVDLNSNHIVNNFEYNDPPNQQVPSTPLLYNGPYKVRFSLKNCKKSFPLICIFCNEIILQFFKIFKT